MKGIKNNAFSRNLEFNLSIEEVKLLNKQNCFYCDCYPNQKISLKSCQNKHYSQEAISHSLYTYNGIDRIDSTKGYFLENCVACCGKCNWLKNSLNEKEFIEIINKIYLNLKSKGII